MNEVKLNFGSVDVGITKGSFGSRITIYRDGKDILFMDSTIIIRILGIFWKLFKRKTLRMVLHGIQGDTAKNSTKKTPSILLWLHPMNEILIRLKSFHFQ